MPALAHFISERFDFVQYLQGNEKFPKIYNFELVKSVRALWREANIARYLTSRSALLQSAFSYSYSQLHKKPNTLEGHHKTAMSSTEHFTQKANKLHVFF